MIVCLFGFWSMAYDTPKILTIKDRTISSNDKIMASISSMPDSPSMDMLNGGHHQTNGQAPVIGKSNKKKLANQKTPLLTGQTSDDVTLNVPTSNDQIHSDDLDQNAPIIIEAKEQLTLWGSMKTAKYWFQFFTTTFGVGGGLLVIYNITQMVEAQGGEDVIILLTLLTILIPLLLLLLLLLVVCCLNYLG
jgi:hypothetical protein